MTTYLMCKKCNKKIKSPIQIKNLDNPGIVIENVTYNCPHCGQIISLKKEEMFNE